MITVRLVQRGFVFMLSNVVRACEHLSTYGLLMLLSVFGVSFVASGQIFFVCNIIEFSILFGVLACCTFFALKIFTINPFSPYLFSYFPDIQTRLLSAFRFSAQVLVFKEVRGPKNTRPGLDEVMFST